MIFDILVIKKKLCDKKLWLLLGLDLTTSAAGVVITVHLDGKHFRYLKEQKTKNT
jgi:hypothetical protein